MTFLKNAVLAASVGVGALALSAAGASADIACNGNTCWHVKEHFQYPRSAHIVIHRDNWKGGPRITFREHEGRGYWRGGAWVNVR